MAAQPRKTGNSPTAARKAAPAKKPAVVAVELPPITKKPVVAQSTQDIKTKQKPRGVALLGAGPGRPKGCPNKTTVECKQAIELAFDKLGGADALVTWGRANPDLFYSRIWIKILPTKIEGTLDLRLADLLAEAAGFGVGK